MHGLLKMLIGAALGKALNEAPPHTDAHTAQNVDILKSIAALDPAKLRGMVFVAVEDMGEGAAIHANVVGDSDVVKTLMQAAEATIVSDDMKRAERKVAEADDCQCSNCQLRRALVGRGLGQDLGDGVAVVLNVGGSIEDIIKEATRKAN